MRIIKKTLALLLAAALLTGIVPASVYAAWLPVITVKVEEVGIMPLATAADLVTTINNYGLGGGSGTALTATAVDNIVTVTGNVTGATGALELNIDADVTVIWQAHYIRRFSPAIALTGPGTFEVQTGGHVGGDAIYANNPESTIKVSGGTVRAESADGVGISSVGSVEVSAGTVEAGALAIALDGASSLTVSGGTVICLETGSGYYAVNISTDSTATVTLSGGTVTGGLSNQSANGTIIIESGYTYAVPSNSVLYNIGNVVNRGTIENNGTITNSSGGYTGYIYNYGTINNNGTINNGTAGWIYNVSGGIVTGSGAIDGNEPTTPGIPAISIISGIPELRIGETVSGEIRFLLTNSIYATDFTPNDFTVGNLPPGLTAGAAVRNSIQIVIPITGTPTAVNTTGVTLTLPTSIPASNFITATGAITPTGDPITLTVAKGFGAAVSGAPVVDGSPTHNSITVSEVTNAGSTGQTVEYAISLYTSPPGDGWQSGTTFNNLFSITTYYVFARTAENTNYAAGEVQMSAAITTEPLLAFITVTSENLDDLKVGQGVPQYARITYILDSENSESTYAATINASNFTPTNLPNGLTAGTAMREHDYVVSVPITGTPTAVAYLPSRSQPPYPPPMCRARGMSKSSAR